MRKGRIPSNDEEEQQAFERRDANIARAAARRAQSLAQGDYTPSASSTSSTPSTEASATRPRSFQRSTPYLGAGLLRAREPAVANWEALSKENWVTQALPRDSNVHSVAHHPSILTFETASKSSAARSRFRLEMEAAYNAGYPPTTFLQLIDERLRKYLNMRMQSKCGEAVTLATASPKFVCDFICQNLFAGSEHKNEETLLNQLRAIPRACPWSFRLDPAENDARIRFTTEVQRVMQEAEVSGEYDATQEPTYVRTLSKQMLSCHPNPLLQAVSDDGHLTVNSFLIALDRAMDQVQSCAAFLTNQAVAASLGPVSNSKPADSRRPPPSRSSESHSAGQSRSTAPSPRATPAAARAQQPCRVCGRTGHSTDGCRLRAHPDANTSELPWAESSMGKQWAAKCGESVLSWRKRLDGSDWHPPEGAAESASKRPANTPQASQANKKGRGEYLPMLCAVHDQGDAARNSCARCSMRVDCIILASDDNLPITVFVDTGCEQGNLIDQAVADRLRLIRKEAAPLRLCSPLSGDCITVSHVVSCDLQFVNALTNQHEVITLLAYVTPLKNSPVQLILGNELIVAEQLTSRMVSCLSGTPQSLPTAQSMTCTPAPAVVVCSNSSTLPPTGSSESVMATVFARGASMPLPASRVADGTIFSKDDLLDPSPETDEETADNLFDDDPFDAVEDPQAPPADILAILLSNTSGSDTFRRQAEQLFKKWESIFSTTVRDEPAHVEPMKFEVDRDKWEHPNNAKPLRSYARQQREEAKHQIDVLLERKVIESCQAIHHSHMLFVKKKDSSWRFCLDFRALNDASEPLGYPLPNIHTMLRRIGDKHPAYFAVIDFTSGYHQMPLAEAIRKFTAFITEWGQFHWNRVPMGLKGATSYFQMTMTNILRGLVHDIREVYIDDVIIYATSEEELIRNLDLVFARIAEYGLVINPRKCATGNSQVEYVGFIINKYGLTISADKRDVVRRIARPATLHELRSFLGLTNYFRQMIAICRHRCTTRDTESFRFRQASETSVDRRSKFSIRGAENSCRSMSHTSIPRRQCTDHPRNGRIGLRHWRLLIPSDRWSAARR